MTDNDIFKQLATQLKAARLDKRLSLQEVEVALRLDPILLQGLESGAAFAWPVAMDIVDELVQYYNRTWRVTVRFTSNQTNFSVVLEGGFFEALFLDLIRVVMCERNLSQGQVAAMLGSNQSTISRLLSRKASLFSDMVASFIDLFEFDLFEISLIRI